MRAPVSPGSSVDLSNPKKKPLTPCELLPMGITKEIKTTRYMWKKATLTMNGRLELGRGM